MSRIRGSNESARAIATRCCMPPDSWYGMCFVKSPSSTSSSISLRPLRAVRLVLAQDLERQLDVVLDAPPVEQDRRLEHHPVVAVAAGLLGGLAVDLDRAAGRLDEVADDAQERRLAAARRADERHELAGRDVEVDARQGDGRPLVARAEHLVDAADLDDGRCAGFGHEAMAPGWWMVRCRCRAGGGGRTSPRPGRGGRTRRRAPPRRRSPPTASRDPSRSTG